MVYRYQNVFTYLFVRDIYSICPKTFCVTKVVTYHLVHAPRPIKFQEIDVSYERKNLIGRDEALSFFLYI